MIEWYSLNEEKISEIESDIDWFPRNNQKLIDFLLEAWYISGTYKQGFAVYSMKEKKWLERCYGLQAEKKLPDDVLRRLKTDLRPYIVTL